MPAMTLMLPMPFHVFFEGANFGLGGGVSKGPRLSPPRKASESKTAAVDRVSPPPSIESTANDLRCILPKVAEGLHGQKGVRVNRCKWAYMDGTRWRLWFLK